MVVHEMEVQRNNGGDVTVAGAAWWQVQVAGREKREMELQREEKSAWKKKRKRGSRF